MRCKTQPLGPALSQDPNPHLLSGSFHSPLEALWAKGPGLRAGHPPKKDELWSHLGVQGGEQGTEQQTATRRAIPAGGACGRRPLTPPNWESTGYAGEVGPCPLSPHLKTRLAPRTCLEALKGLFWTTNYWEVFAHLKLLRGWELFEHLETYTEGVTLLAR